MPQSTLDDKSTLVQVLACCRQVTSHFWANVDLNQWVSWAFKPLKYPCVRIFVRYEWQCMMLCAIFFSRDWSVNRNVICSRKGGTHRCIDPMLCTFKKCQIARILNIIVLFRRVIKVSKSGNFAAIHHYHYSKNWLNNVGLEWNALKLEFKATFIVIVTVELRYDKNEYDTKLDRVYQWD